MLNQDVVATEAPANSRGAWELDWAFRVDLNRSKEAFQLHLSFLQVSNSVYNFRDLWLCLPGSFHAQWRGPVWLSVTSWCVACQAPLSMGFSRQEYWRGLHFPLPGDLPDPEIESESLKSCSVMSHSLWPHGLVHGILQARILEWVACPFFRGFSQPRDLNPSLPCCRQILYQLNHKRSPRILEWVAYPFSSLFFLTQELNQGFLHCRQILYQLSYEGSPASLVSPANW